MPLNLRPDRSDIRFQGKDYSSEKLNLDAFLPISQDSGHIFLNWFLFFWLKPLVQVGKFEYHKPYNRKDFF